MFLVEITSVNIIIMQKHQKYRVAKKSSESVAALQHNLFQQLESINNKTEYSPNPDSLFAEFEEYGDSGSKKYAPRVSLLSKAKQIVSLAPLRPTPTRAKSKR